MKGALEIIRPPVSIQAEPHVVLVDGNTSRKGTTEAARAYLEYLYTPAAQSIIADMFFRPVDWEKTCDSRRSSPCGPQIPVSISATRRNAIQKHFFGEGGVFDQVFQRGGD